MGKRTCAGGISIGAGVLFALLAADAAAQSGAHAPGRAQVPAAFLPRPDDPQFGDLWFRFHESGLCRDVDAVFVFTAGECGIWGTAGDERALNRLRELAAPARKGASLSLYLNRRTEEKISDPDPGPPPSLWNNGELIRSMWDPFGRETGFAAPGQPPDPAALFRVTQFKQRLRMFALQILEWNGSLKSYGSELPLLAATAWQGKPGEAARRAAAICAQHALETGKLAGRLGESLSQALPRTEKPPAAERRARQRRLPEAPGDLALELSRACREASRSVHGFIYPKVHTVGLGDLREPGMIDALEEVRRIARALAK